VVNKDELLQYILARYTCKTWHHSHSPTRSDPIDCLHHSRLASESRERYL